MGIVCDRIKIHFIFLSIRIEYYFFVSSLVFELLALKISHFWFNNFYYSRVVLIIAPIEK